MASVLLVLLLGCNPDPGETDQEVGYRTVLDDKQNGERGTVKISEVMWSGSVRRDGTDFVWDQDDIFIEFRNESARPVNLTGWRIELTGAIAKSWKIPAGAPPLQVGEHGFLAKKADGCFVDPNWVLPDLVLPYNDAFQITLLDPDERLIEPAGDDESPPFAGGYDFVVSRSMERIELMFGGRGSEPHAWHHYTLTGQTSTNVIDNIEDNRGRVQADCRERTHASPGWPNSPDYSGAFSTGSFE